MIVKCKICGGNGFIHSGDPFGDILGRVRNSCPSCNGAGEFDLNVPQEKLTTCKYCGGRGLIASPSFTLFESIGKICSICKGLGVLERPQIGIEKVSAAKPETASSTAVELHMQPAQPEATLTPDEQERALKPIEIKTLVNRYIGVNQGYLGDFSYQRHRDFYTDLGLDINPDAIQGTTRERFTKILAENCPQVQAKILEGILHLYRVGSSELRTEERGREIQGWITRLRGTSQVVPPRPSITSDVVERALNDAETLIEKHDATSGVDRAHTAFHGFLHAICDAAGIAVSDDTNMPTLLAVIRDKHPKFAVKGPRDEEITKVIRSLSTIVDALNTIRNRASVAHPNPRLLGAPEAMLMINIVRSLLHYLDTKLNEPSA